MSLLSLILCRHAYLSGLYLIIKLLRMFIFVSN